MSQHLTPLEVVECLVVPLRDLGRVVAAHPKSPYGWRAGSKYRDPGDMPPRVNRRLLDYARRRDLPLTADHLIRGGKWSDIEELARSIGRTMPQHLRRKPADHPAPEPLAAE